MISRREFVVTAAKCGACLLAPVGLLESLGVSLAEPETTSPSSDFREDTSPGALGSQPKQQWAYLIDTTKCVGCGLCVEACKIENEVPLDASVSRTWVERYVVTKDGKVHADSPKAGREGFTSKQIELGEGEQESIKAEDIAKDFFVPKTCNHCANPPCVQVCPVGATYRTEDGVILVDRKTCIGCGYCVMACPYGARFFHPAYNTAEKCTLCYHRITKGLKPACVQACPFEARLFGDSSDPNDPVSKTIATERVNVLKDDYGTKPQVHYIGLSKEVR